MFGSFIFVVLLLVTTTSAGFVPSALLYSHPYGFIYLPSNRHYDATGDVHGRTPIRKDYSDRPVNPFYQPANFISETESRILPSLRNPLQNLAINSRLSSLTSGFAWLDGTTCTSPNAEAGICASQRACSGFGGRSSGSCNSFGTVCCINTVTKCGETVTVNNTYWQSPASVNTESTCSLSIRLDPTLMEQRRNPICQVRLDFETFTIAQPNAQTICQVDNFRISGTTNKVPIICGQNVGQHMYLTAPSSTVDIQLIFTLNPGTSNDRNWRIRIGLLPCSSPDILAPPDCLQYFRQSSGTVRSFNWREMSAASTAVRQLANQDYNICFRTEQIANTNSISSVSSTICFAPCGITTVTPPQTTPLAFSLTGDSTASFPLGGAGSGSTITQCANTDYIVIDGAVDPAVATNFNDRFCGNQLNAQSAPASTTSVTLCTTVKPFNIYYRTDGSEAASEFGNNGFCLRFEQRAS